MCHKLTINVYLVTLRLCVVCAGASAQLDAAVGSLQLRRAGKAGGAEAEVAQVLAAAHLRPNTRIVGLGIKNALGSANWHQALEVLLSSAPKLAPPLANLWSNG